MPQTPVFPARLSNSPTHQPAQGSAQQARKRPLLMAFKRQLLALALCGFAASAFAQEGKLKLTVVDTNTQRPIAGAQVTLIPRKGEPIQLTLDALGRAQLRQLAPGLYEVRIAHPNYQSARLPRVRVVDNKTTPISTGLSPTLAVEELVVLGQANPGNPLNPVSASVIDRESLNSAAGSGSDVLRSLDGLPGLFGDGEFSSFTVRGNGPRDNLILVDGIPYDNVVHFSDSFGELEDIEGGGRYSVFAPNMIASAEFQPGGWGSAYAGRAGSLLKLNVAEGNPDSASYRTRLDIAGIEIGYDGPSGIHDNTAVLFSARDYDFGRLFETIGLDAIGTPKLTDVIFKSTTQASDSDKVNLLALYAPESYTRNLDNVLASNEDEPGVYEDVELVEADTDNSLLAASWSRLVGDDGEWLNQIYWRHYDERAYNGEAYPDLVAEGTPASDIPVRERLLFSQREETEQGWQSDFSTSNALGRFAAGLRLTQVDLAFALDLREDWIRYTYDQQDFRPDSEQKYITLTPAAINNSYQQQETNYAVYADQEFSLSDWRFRAGARYDRDGFSDEDLWSPRLGATWILNSDLRIAASAGRYYQAPRSNDRASDASNSQLENEVTDQISLGFSYRLDTNLDLFIEPYYQQLSKQIVDGDAVNRTRRNSGEGESYGVDMALTRQFDNGWSANFNYSYNQARLRAQEGADYYDADFNRPHIVSLGGVWEINQRWKLSARWKWASGKPSDSYLVHENVLGDGQPLRYSRETLVENNRRYGHYSALNFRADYIRSFGDTNVIAFIDIINLLGSENPGTANFNERTGKNETEDGSAIPLVGLLFEW